MKAYKQIELALNPQDVIDMTLTYIDEYLISKDEDGKEYVMVNEATQEKFYLTEMTTFTLSSNGKGQMSILFSNPAE